VRTRALYSRADGHYRNTLILISVLCGLHPGKADIALTGASLLAFLVFAFVFARASLIRAPRSRKRGWILFSLAVQNMLHIIPAVLLSSRAIVLPGRWDWVLIGLLAASAGIQVVMVSSIQNYPAIEIMTDAGKQARTTGNPEIPSAMLTSPFIDFMIDPNLFKPIREPDSRSRNVRMSYLASLIAGGFVGGGLQRVGGTLTVIWVAFGLKMLVMAWIHLVERDAETLPKNSDVHS
jgi:hypothetical protein